MRISLFLAVSFSLLIPRLFICLCADLSEPIDVYSEWVDECEKQAKRQAEEGGALDAGAGAAAEEEDGDAAAEERGLRVSLSARVCFCG